MIQAVELMFGKALSSHPLERERMRVGEGGREVSEDQKREMIEKFLSGFLNIGISQDMGWGE
jgi:hypothetical protein